ncbi:hypothetical protein [Allorhodopirellula solitaria]|uniref:Uncharacterized protein n=1 Tax=Allorhodopirellula solitaria TaxID=2527987 RepID=A0A5C5XV78_9BACT|nr:hypothetical protein [Allorhodopirellula solitaria]TWT66409.1 hypothetical protein CA85_25030 [Allorhodopirellula solitaria]
MSKTEQQMRAMYLSGTVSIPPRFPDLAEISFSRNDSREGPVFVTATQRLSPKLVIKRSFFAPDVTSLFIPNDTNQVDLEQGTWLEGEVLAEKAYDLLEKGTVTGIIYVREFAQSILEMEAGLTAAESAQYYPPLPDDRSVDHYCMHPEGVSAGCR